MLTTNDIKNVRFSNAMGGYRKEEVEIFLDKIESDYTQYERLIKDYESKLEKCEEEIKGFKDLQGSIQSVLFSAQGLADDIVNEAKEKSEEIIRNAENNIAIITQKEKELSASFELKAQQRKTMLEKELSDMVKEAQLKADSITAAANDCVRRQQMLFDKLKLEIAAFKSSINSKYKEHLEILSNIPDSVPNDPEYLSKLVAENFYKAPKAEQFVSSTPEVVEELPIPEEIVVEETWEGFKVAENI